ncbi:MAG TPA: flavin reductase family protein [Spirochaetota bacterium]|nr:flavin reductase family protein [Spirochaetota bacterium]HPL15354.1 flavin reductase family protein [Spirochaetota bacterium]HQF08263.1 flavin reductase family protein [Spirochaetota bacterium]HQH97122.1 flavin reductase family protein [Spirochaetota bacterium]HQJ70032.1 flavin reductase family protein [Spirochaetota bacterium]
MNHVKVSTNTFIPMPMSIVGTIYNGKENFMAVGWVARVNAKPPMIAVGIGKNHATCGGIIATKAFSVNIPGKDLLVKTDYVGIVSGHGADKSRVFDLFYGDVPGAPLIREASVCLECLLVHSVDLPTNMLFVGEIRGAWCDEGCLDGKSPDYNRIGSFFLTMPDNRYWAFGENVGTAWSDGRRYGE